MDLLDFEPPLLCQIGEYLPAKNLASVRRVCKRMQKLMPRLLVISNTLENFHGLGDHYDPIREFTTLCTLEDKRYAIGSVMLNFTWKDQGWGYRKGSMWIKLYRDNVEISSEKYPELAPQDGFHRVNWRIDDETSPVIRKAQTGDTLKVMILVGGGGCHQLFIQRFTRKILFKIKA
jgi:hypothetical protein